MNENNNKRKSFLKKNGSKLEGIYAKFRNHTIILHPTVLVLATYVMLLFSKIIDITLVNRENEYFSVVILQMMIFILPGAIWCMFSGEKYMQTLRLKAFKPRHLILIVSATVVMAMGGLIISLLIGGLESLSNNFSLYDTFISKSEGTIPSKIYLVMAYAVLPAIGEEFIYRGILCSEYEKGGVTRAIVFSSLFFALLHFNLHNLPVYIFSGIILALTLYATKSLFGAILTHFLYNIFGIFGQSYMGNLYRITTSPKLFVILAVLLFLVAAIVFCSEAARLYKNYLYKGSLAEYRQPVIKNPKIKRKSYIDVIKTPSAIACFAIYILALIISWI
ncbi:MAG: CPBP family intramembrane metalloprotease [Ruminococcaceae bacterium]|nr:CPBP family intramembrane metalloprotease [Oscillospiraceae bacterium]